MSVVVAVRDEDKIWLATDSQVTAGWTKSLLLSQHSFKIFKGRNKVNIGGVGSLRDLNIISTSDVDFISENDIFTVNRTMDVQPAAASLSVRQNIKKKEGTNN